MARLADTFVGTRVYNNANISIPNNVATVLTYNSERYDTDTIHSTSSNTSRLTCFTAGKYIITSNIVWESNNASYRQIRLFLNGATIIAATRALSVTNLKDFQFLVTKYDLALTDYVEVEVKHEVGVAQNVEVQSNYSPEFMMHRIAP